MAPDTSAPEALRRLAQAVAAAFGEMPVVSVGDEERVEEAELHLEQELPPELRLLYLDSNPVSLTVPLASEDVELIALDDLADSQEALDSYRDSGASEGDLLVIAREGEAVYAVRFSDDEVSEVLAGSESGGSWEWETAARSIADFLKALYTVVDAYARHEAPDIASRLEIGTEAQLEVAARLANLDEELADRWLEWLG